MLYLNKAWYISFTSIKMSYSRNIPRQIYIFISTLATKLTIIFLEDHINCLSKQQLWLKNLLQTRLPVNIKQVLVNTAHCL